MDENINQNPLATAPIWSLIRKFAIPAATAMLVSAIYNITDQIFIGHVIGMNGNAATNIAFPLVTFVVSISLMLGFGGAANFNLNMGEGKKEEATHYIGNSVVLMAILGAVIMISTLFFLEPLMRIFGASDVTLPLAMTYTRITAWGIPFLIFATASSHLIRADGSPTYAMVSTLVGAILNIFLDALFMFPLGLGMAGAAYATVIGQIVSAVISVGYLFRFKTVRLTKEAFTLKLSCLKNIARLGTSSFLNQIIMMAIQIIMNNSLKYYGGVSVYGEDIPIAVVGVISKVGMIAFSVLIGIGQGCQPIFGYNYGAKNYGRVKETYKKGAVACISISVLAFLAFQLFPREIVSIFGTGSPEYFDFAEHYMRIFMMMMFINGIHPLTANFFTSTGKAKQGIFLSISRQGLFLIPLLLILPSWMGLNGVLYAGPISDAMAAVISILFVYVEFKKMGTLQAEETGKKHAILALEEELDGCEAELERMIKSFKEKEYKEGV